MAALQKPDKLVVLSSALGWTALIGSGRVVKQVTLGHPSARAAVRALDPRLRENARPGPWNRSLVRRIQAYASGARQDFGDIEVDLGPLAEFRRQVIRRCRQIPFAQTLTYGELAAESGYPGAARAVGNCMAGNRIPLIIPCHRVVAAAGRLGGYSGPGGIRLKKRLLELEAGR